MSNTRAFGPWLRQLRTTQDLTQERLADAAGCAPETIRSFENGRRRPSRAIARRLAEVLGLPPEEAERFVGLARGDQEQPPATPPPASQPAPALPGDALAALRAEASSLIGRRPELERLRGALLAEGRRLVTLLGPGGVGKTRLALQTAADLAGGFPDGSVFVPLAPVADGSEALSALAEAVGCALPPGVRPADALLAFLAPRRLLLTLDNLEHLLGPAQPEQIADLAARIVREAPDVQLLVTSRERLQLQAEWVVELGGLGLPADDSPAGIARSDAVLLFVERARRTSGAFALGPATQEAVARICRRLEGLPLAIELAAAQVSFLPPAALLQRLDQALAILEGGARDLPERQRTMRATIDWSYNLLSEDERLLFQRLAVFMGGFTLEAGEAVGAGGAIRPEQCLRLLGRLVNQSLVQREEAGEAGARYRLLEPVRQYALERLEEREGEAAATQGRHAAYFVALSAAAEPLLRTAEQVRTVERLEREYANLSAAMAWLLARGEAATAAGFGRTLWLFLWLRGHFRQGLRWMEEALAQLPQAPSRGRADALLTICVLAYGQADYGRAAPLAEQALAAYEAIGHEWGVAESLSMVGLIAAALQQHERAAQVMEPAVARSLAVGNRWSAAMTLTYWAPILLNQGAYRRAAALAEQALGLARELGDRIAEYSARYNLALVAQAEGDAAAARGLFAAALALAVELGDEGNVVSCLKGLGGVAVAQRQPQRAARLWGAAEALHSAGESAQYAYTLDQALYEQMLERAQAGVDATAWAAAWAEGRAMSQRQAVAYALGE
jgi:predicted ATPase/DNA-binding XRE family transcriptional regulator